MIEVLVGCGVVKDVWAGPIHAVDRAMGWHTLKTTEFVKDLIDRGLVHWEAIVAEGQKFDPKSCWKEGKLES